MKKKLNKQNFILNLENKTEEQLKKAIDIFQNLNDEQLNKPSAEGGWSITQCLEHLNTYSNYYLPRIKHFVEQDRKEDNQEFVSGWLGQYFTSMMDPDKNNKKYKAATMHNPVDRDAHVVVAEFINQQEELIVLLRRCIHADLNRSRIAISIQRLIKLKLGDILQFLVMHNERHVRQAIRNL